MSIPFFIPPPLYLQKLSLKQPLSIQELCQQAQILCCASGDWINRCVEIIFGQTLKIYAEPGDWGGIRIEIPSRNKKQQARIALVVLAYGMQDLVAKQSLIHSKVLFPLKAPQGRPRKERPLSSKERQRKFRARHKQLRTTSE